MNDFKTQEVLVNLSQKTTLIDAINFYKENYKILEDWRYIYASNDDCGAFKLKNTIIDKTVGIQSIYKGKSLFIIDSNIMTHKNKVHIFMWFGYLF